MVNVTKFYCEYCDIHTKTQTKLDEHFQTNKHKKKDEDVKKNLTNYELFSLIENDFTKKFEEQEKLNEKLTTRVIELEKSIKKMKIEKVQNLYMNYKILFEKYEKLLKMSKTQNDLLLDTIDILKNN